jgi:hypothetical protein
MASTLSQSTSYRRSRIGRSDPQHVVHCAPDSTKRAHGASAPAGAGEARRAAAAGGRVATRRARARHADTRRGRLTTDAQCDKASLLHHLDKVIPYQVPLIACRPRRLCVPVSEVRISIRKLRRSGVTLGQVGELVGIFNHVEHHTGRGGEAASVPCHR